MRIESGLLEGVYNYNGSKLFENVSLGPFNIFTGQYYGTRLVHTAKNQLCL
jgi:hypothetical protein